MVQQNVMFFQMTQQNVMISLTDQQIVMFFQVNAFFFWQKTDFRPVFPFLAKRKSGHFSVIPAGTGSVVNVGHFFGDPDGPNKFRWSRTKIKGTSLTNPPTPKKGQNPARRPKNGPPSGQPATYRKTEVIQSYLRTWGTYDPIESGPSDPKKWGLYRRSVKKCCFLGQKWAPAARRATGSKQKCCHLGVQSWWWQKV